MEAVKSQQTNSYTEDEKALAQKYKVEPKTVRLISEIVSDHAEGIKDLVALTQGSPAKKAGYEIGLRMPLSKQPEVEVQEQPTIDQQTQERIKAYYKGLDPKAKLAICTFSELECLDGLSFQASQKEGKLIDEIRSDLLDTCLEIYGGKTNEFWFAGVWESTRMILQNC